MFQVVDALELSELIAERKGAQFVTLNTTTIPKLIGGKKNQYTGRIEKKSVVNGMVNWDYTNAVNKQRMREGTPMIPVVTVKVGDTVTTLLPGDTLPASLVDAKIETAVELFNAEKRSWGQRIEKTAFVRHIKEVRKNVSEKRVYIELKVERSITNAYFIDGKLVDNAVVKDSIRAASESSRQEVEKQVILRDYRLSSITGIKIGGQFYDVGISDASESALYDQLEPLKKVA
jgi:hypothetical protein